MISPDDKTKECGLEVDNCGDIHTERPLVDAKQAIRDYWTLNSSLRAAKQTTKEWVSEYDTGIPSITVRLVKANPLNA